MKGIWKNPEATREAFFEGGWLRSGDAGYFDDEGFLYVHDRVKDMIITGAENVYPAEVENALFGHPAVADVAVIGVPDPRWGEAVRAIIVLKPGKRATPNDIIAYARERIAGYKLLKSTISSRRCRAIHGQCCRESGPMRSRGKETTNSLLSVSKASGAQARRR